MMTPNALFLLIITTIAITNTMGLLIETSTTQIPSFLPGNSTGNSTVMSANSKKPNYNNRVNSKLRYLDNSRNKKRSISQVNKMDRTIIGAIVIGSIFLFITLSITVTVIIFCLKKNTVFVFQKSEQEDINDCTYDDCVDSISCQSSLHYFDRPCSTHNSLKSTCRNHYNRPCVNDFLEHCPVELFYPMHYDKPCPIQASQVKRYSQRRCRCCQVKQQYSLNRPANNFAPDPSLWNKLNESTQYRPLFTNNTSTPLDQHRNDDVRITLDFIANRRVVTTNEVEKTNVDDKPLLQDCGTLMLPEPDGIATQLVLTPLGKSQTYTDLNQSQAGISSTLANSQSCADRKLTKSVSNYDARINNNRKY